MRSQSFDSGCPTYPLPDHFRANIGPWPMKPRFLSIALDLVGQGTARVHERRVQCSALTAPRGPAADAASTWMLRISTAQRTKARSLGFVAIRRSLTLHR